MMNMLGVSLIQFLSSPLIIIGLILLAFGVATVCLAKRITRVARQTNKVGGDDKLYVTFKVIGLLLMMAGFVLVGVDIVLYIIY
ncbi:MAG: hypothetical protein IJD48_00865 [Clostridia bacterium]|nr:hypothetical protein [Clostridia bacterium]